MLETLTQALAAAVAENDAATVDRLTDALASMPQTATEAHRILSLLFAFDEQNAD